MHSIIKIVKIMNVENGRLKSRSMDSEFGLNQGKFLINTEKK